MIDVRGIHKFYGEKRAIDNLSFKIDDGETIGILGLNGAGKSTVLKILGCFLMPSTGEAFIGGHSVVENPMGVRRQIGYLPDIPPIYPEMTVKSYLTFAALLKDVGKSEVESFVLEAIRKTNLQEVQEYRLSELSHGFRQRVGIAQALVHKPKVLILDEPINGLDPIQIVEMRDLILSLKSKHTVLLSSHILSEITKTCDRILVIDRGRLVAEGRESELRMKVKQTFEVRIEWSRYEESLVQQLKNVDGVKDVIPTNGSFESGCFIICERDLRSTISRAVVNSGVELLGLSRKEAELESLFLRLINKESTYE